MEDKLQQFLDQAFAPYGKFPARADVTRELLGNLQEKFADLKKEGKSDDEAYQATIDSFGDIAEIMEQVPHQESREAGAAGQAKARNARLKASSLKQADLSYSGLNRS